MAVVIRPAMFADRGDLLAIMGDEPTAEQIGISGNRRLAKKARRKLNEMLFEPKDLPRTLVLVNDGDPIGLMQLGSEADAENFSPKVIWMALSIFGPIGIIGLIRRLRAVSRVQFDNPADSLHIAELHVREDMRSKGFGVQLLRFAEERAVSEKRARMSLTTQTSNPARRLYERSGFVVVDQKTDAEFERLTGIEGRILMVKELARATT